MASRWDLSMIDTPANCDIGLVFGASVECIIYRYQMSEPLSIVKFH